MPDVPDRDKLERELARQLGPLQKRQLAALLEYMGDPPDINRVPTEFWDEVGEELAKVLIPFSENVYLDAAERMMNEVGRAVDWTLVNRDAANFARQHGYDVSYAMVETRTEDLQKLIPRYFEEQWTQGELTRRLSKHYNDYSSEMIARTEVTRAAVQGERGVAAELRKQGIEMVEVWQTRFDELVCAICQPRDGKSRGDGWDSDKEPPAHPRCRCWITLEFPEDD